MPDKDGPSDQINNVLDLLGQENRFINAALQLLRDGVQDDDPVPELGRRAFKIGGKDYSGYLTTGQLQHIGDDPSPDVAYDRLLDLLEQLDSLARAAAGALKWAFPKEQQAAEAAPAREVKTSAGGKYAPCCYIPPSGTLSSQCRDLAPAACHTAGGTFMSAGCAFRPPDGDASEACCAVTLTDALPASPKKRRKGGAKTSSAQE
jgi:hypothetical protein